VSSLDPANGVVREARAHEVEPAPGQPPIPAVVALDDLLIGVLWLQ